MTTPQYQVLVTQRFFDADTQAYLRAHGCEPVIVDLPAGRSDGDFSEAELTTLLRGVDGWIVGHAHVTDGLLCGLPRLQVIARRGVGYDRVDTEAVTRHGKVATIATGGNDACVADHTIALMLAVAHRLREGQLRLTAGDWSIPLGSDLYRKTVGIIGLGRIGQGVVQRLRGFETRVLVHTRRLDPVWAEANGVSGVDLPTLLAQCDVVSLHAPLTPDTRFLIDNRALARMKPGAILINTARGGLVDDRHLLAALQAGQLMGAGLDVFASEADPAFLPVTAELVALPNVVATPHAGASTREGLARTNQIAAESIVAVLQGRHPPVASLIADGRASFSHLGF